MSDYHDYKENLAFPPQEIKSQDDIKHQDTRSSDVLIKAVEKCEKLENENQQLKELLRYCRFVLDLNGYVNTVDEIDNALGEKK